MREQLIEQVRGDQKQLRRLILEAASPQWAQLDLTMRQLKALVTVAEGGPLPVGRLGDMLGIGKPAATLLVDALARRGLVVRREDPDDCRRTLVQISPEGERLRDELLQGRLERMTGWMAQLGDGDLAALARGTRALMAIAYAESRARSQ